jgi:hypothetical protein
MPIYLSKCEPRRSKKVPLLLLLFSDLHIGGGRCKGEAPKKL